MSAPVPTSEILLCGIVVVKKARGPGWIVGEPYGRHRGDEDGIGIVRPAYYGDPLSALISGLSRTANVLEARGSPEGAKELLGGSAQLISGDFEDALLRVGTVVKDLRNERGMTRAQLARKAGVARSTVWRAEEGRKRLGTETAARLLGALARWD